MTKFIIRQRSIRIKASVINGRKEVGIKKLKNPKAFTEHSQTIDDIFENLEDCYPRKKTKVLIVFDDVIADVKANKK